MGRFWVVLSVLVFSTVSFAVDFQKALKETSEGQTLAKNSGNAYCELREQSTGSVQGYQTDRLVSLASVSKVITSFWATEVLGPQYRFETKLHVKMVNPSVVDVHIQGSYDPLLNREKLIFLVSELNKKGIQHIRNLSFDQNAPVFLNARSIPHTEIGVNGGVPLAETAANLKAALNTKSWSSAMAQEFAEARVNAKLVNVEILSNLNLVTDNVQYLPAEMFEQNQSTGLVLTLGSSPLTQYLKEMNVYSNNYIADTLWTKLGGKKQFDQFLAKRLKLDGNSIQFHSGSGLPVEDEKGQRLENKATCGTVLEILVNLDKRLESEGLGLPDVMLVGGVDSGTLPGYTNEAMSGAVVAKTGTIRDAITLAGYTSTQKGKYYFGIFFKVTDSSQIGKARLVRDHIVAALIRQNGGKLSVKYRKGVMMPFDSTSALQENMETNKP